MLQRHVDALGCYHVKSYHKQNHANRYVKKNQKQLILFDITIIFLYHSIMKMKLDTIEIF